MPRGNRRRVKFDDLENKRSVTPARPAKRGGNVVFPPKKEDEEVKPKPSNPESEG